MIYVPPHLPHVGPDKRLDVFRENRGFQLLRNRSRAQNVPLGVRKTALTVLAGIFLAGGLAVYPDLTQVDAEPGGASRVMELAHLGVDDAARPPDVIKSLLTYNSFQPLVSRLMIERDRGNLTFGQAEFFLNPDRCYIFVFDKSEEALVTVLAPGDTDRVDLLSDRRVQNVPEYLVGKAAIYVLPTG